MVNKGYKVRSGKFSCFFPIGRGYVLSNAARNVPGLVVCVSFQSFFPHACINRYRFCCLRSCYGQTGLQHNFSSARGVYYSCFLSPTRVETKFHVISLGSWVDFFFFRPHFQWGCSPRRPLGPQLHAEVSALTPCHLQAPGWVSKPSTWLTRRRPATSPGAAVVSGSNSLPQLEAPFLSLELGGFRFLQTHLCI